ncbi:phosphate signaling complex PhoU family protein [Sulfuricurvum sp.]|uniref:phosphate signaling complex PhoU family protein n=1 Tax=Sulfuricurvum sp. TaxID=2025608 RepID=UPI002D4F156B|nr:PhoU domain-containing protein [Sulfuricurvum sp.]HZF70088.1 PhoU domain-containing protein [Sulfuricurvum sp.]
MLPSYEHKLIEIREMISMLLHDILLSSKQSLEAFENRDRDIYASVQSKIKTIKAVTDNIDTKTIQTIALFGPEANELRDLIVYLKMTNEIDRIVDSIDKYCKRFCDYICDTYNLSPFNDPIVYLHTTTIHTLEYIYDFMMDIEHCNAHDLYRKVVIEESINDDIFSIIEKDILALIMTNSEHSMEYINVLGTLKNLERIADRGVSIAALLVYAQKGGELHLRSQIGK